MGMNMNQHVDYEDKLVFISNFQKITLNTSTFTVLWIKILFLVLKCFYIGPRITQKSLHNKDF